MIRIKYLFSPAPFSRSKTYPSQLASSSLASSLFQLFIALYKSSQT